MATTSAGIASTMPKRLGTRELLALGLLPLFQFVVAMLSLPAVVGLLVCLVLVWVSDRWRPVDKVAACLIAPATTVAIAVSDARPRVYVCADLEGYDCGPDPLTQAIGTIAIGCLLGLPILLALRSRRPTTSRESRDRNHVDTAIVVLLAVVVVVPIWVDNFRDPLAGFVVVPMVVVLATCMAALWCSSGWIPRDKWVATALVTVCVAAHLWLFQTRWRGCADYPDIMSDYHGVNCQSAVVIAGVLQWTVGVAALGCAAFLYLRHRR